jgi:hypothetical protein
VAPKGSNIREIAERLRVMFLASPFSGQKIDLPKPCAKRSESQACERMLRVVAQNLAISAHGKEAVALRVPAAANVT